MTMRGYSSDLAQQKDIMKILNLYSGLGGNRKAFGDDHDVTAIEYDDKIAQVYRDRFPNDNVIVADAHEYLQDHFDEYDFIWSSPPCQSHSNFRQNINVRYRGAKAIYPDLKLYEEILFLKYNFKGKYVVENVRPYYNPLIEASARVGRHLIWSNFYVMDRGYKPTVKISGACIKDWEKYHGIDLSGYKFPNKRQLLRNCVDDNVARWIFHYITKSEKL